jgi:hypothetical protein
MLVSGNPEDQKHIKRMIVKMGKGKTIDKGAESIKVPAGTLTARHIQYHQYEEFAEDTWIHKDVSPYGVVKSKSKFFEMVLLGYGTGAKTQITESPQKFEMAQMPSLPPIRK